jgi:hypothetical protein
MTWWDVVVLLGFLAAGLTCYALFTVYAYVRYRPVYNARKHLTFADFLKGFDGSTYRKEALDFAYEDLTGLTRHPILRFDHLQNTLQLHPEDVADAMNERIDKSGLPDACARVHIETVEDYVAFLSFVLEHGEKGEA